MAENKLASLGFFRLPSHLQKKKELAYVFEWIRCRGSVLWEMWILESINLNVHPPPPRKTNGSTTWKCILKEKEKTCAFPTSFCFGSVCQFSGGVSFNKIPREVPYDSKWGEVAHGFCWRFFFHQKAPMLDFGSFLGRDMFAKKHIGCLKKKT